jgi:hypothetical protein
MMMARLPCLPARAPRMQLLEWLIAMHLHPCVNVMPGACELHTVKVEGSNNMSQFSSPHSDSVQSGPDVCKFHT